MRRTKWLLIAVLVMAGVGCGRRDWVSDLLVLTDVTGTWEGSVNNARFGAHSQALANLLPRTPITIVLQQSGPKVTGELSWARGQGRVEGLVNGEVVTLNVGIRAELAVDGDEMWGKADDPLFASASNVVCPPCFLRFRRVNSPVPASSEPQAR